MKKLALGIGLLALCGGMMACSDVDCSKEYDECKAACATNTDVAACEAVCGDDLKACEDQTCTTPLIIQEVTNLKGTVNYADTGAENCLVIASNVTQYLADDVKRAGMVDAVTDWSDFEKGNWACKTLNGILVLSALIDLYTIEQSIKSCETTFADPGLADKLAQVKAAYDGLTSVEGISAALQAGAKAAADQAGK